MGRIAALKWERRPRDLLGLQGTCRGWTCCAPWQFALSGFLIAGQLLRPWARGVMPEYLRFITRRLLRTLPAYLVVLGIYFLVPSLRDGSEIQP